MRFIKFGTALYLLTAFMMLTACDGNNQEVIKVGTMGTYFPFSHTDEDGDLTGYDVEVMRLLDKKMKDVEFEFVTKPIDALFTDLDAGSINMIACQIAKSPEREEKYIFSADGYLFAQTKLIVSASNYTSTSLMDMKGKTMGGLTGDYFTELIEAYNEENGNPYEIKYYEGEYDSIFSDVARGRVDGTLNDTTVVNGYATNKGLNVKAVGDTIESSYSYLCIRDDIKGQILKAKLDEALKEALDDGSLAKLSVEWFGEDITR